MHTHVHIVHNACFCGNRHTLWCAAILAWRSSVYVHFCTSTVPLVRGLKSIFACLLPPAHADVDLYKGEMRTERGINAPGV